MYPPEAIDFERPYVSPYLRRRCRSLAEVEAAHRDGAAAWMDTLKCQGGYVPRCDASSQLRTTTRGHDAAPAGQPGPLHHHAQPKGGE